MYVFIHGCVHVSSYILKNSFPSLDSLIADFILPLRSVHQCSETLSSFRFHVALSLLKYSCYCIYKRCRNFLPRARSLSLFLLTQSRLCLPKSWSTLGDAFPTRCFGGRKPAASPEIDTFIHTYISNVCILYIYTYIQAASSSCMQV
jgi:hypothetical protein